MVVSPYAFLEGGEMKESDSATGKAEEQTGESIDHERREAVIRLGKYAAYTAPAMLAVLMSVDPAGSAPPAPVCIPTSIMHCPPPV
jgi:hypothetical protein